ncbi:hypothetical protein [Acuticoccus yangtzensis]|uniref:hypothetical protein n=1 Tax=Acuticoccus yangtzensis TaxID=1443441 RepID=UPI000949ADA8|nr:hypothetical protein [Acuticoccus yangtzensis]ORE93501.1 hypothetical protein ATO13_12526 [Stappia sp. 22II-S9-Z10]
MYKEFFQAAYDWNDAAWSGAQMWMSATSVIQTRTLQMMTGTMRADEAARMLMEKPSAFAKSAEMTMRAMAGNKGIGAVVAAGIKPISASATANAKRLARSGKRH